MSTTAVPTFLAQLRKAQILDEQQLAEAERLGKTAARPAELASELIKRGWLTPYQANQVARGRGEELVLGSYVVLETLATGGMGQVVKARHRYMGRTVALKLIRRDQRESADSVQRFQREVRLLADLRHPHIVQAYDAGNIDAVCFLAMELLDGIDLDRLVRQRGPLPVGQACDFIRQAALGLAHAHERGLVHRDIKPSNLFLTSEGIKLLDLGLARPQALSDEKQPGDLTRANTVMGTPDYLAPEQALDPRRADARSDLYSLGCTLYALLTGRPPFPEGTLAQKLLYHQSAEPPAVETLRREVPPALAGLLRRLLAKSPAHRPASAAVVATELGPLAAPGPDWLAAAGQASADSRRPKSTVVPGPSLVSAQSAAPERGFTLTTESIPPAAAASLRNSQALAPERGWTLATESLPPAPAVSLIDAARAAPERGFTLVTESLPPTTGFSAGPSTAGPQESHAALPAERPAPARPAWLLPAALAFTGAGLVLLVIVLVVLLGGKGGDVPNPPHGPAVADRQENPRPRATPRTKQADPAREPQVDPNPPGPKVKRKLAALDPTGPKETGDVFVMPTIAPDMTLTRRKAADKVFLSDMKEFAFKTTPTNWRFAKNGCVGDPRDPAAQMRVNGTPYVKGLGMHPPNTDYIRVCYALGGRGETLRGAVALDDGEHRPWSIKTTFFTVIGDGKVLWRSQGHKERGVVEPFTVDVRDVAVLELRVYTDYNGANGSRAVWLDPYVVVGKAD